MTFIAVDIAPQFDAGRQIAPEPALLVTRGLYRAMKLNDPFEQVAAAGLFVLVGQQAFINVAVNLNLIPTKGMTLPFISYGGSSMMAMGLTLGMALALTRRRPGAYA